MVQPAPGKREEVAAARETVELHEAVAAHETVAPPETRDSREIHETVSLPSTHASQPIAPDSFSVAVAASPPAAVHPVLLELSTSAQDMLRGSPPASPAAAAMRRHSARVVYGREQQDRAVDSAGRTSEPAVAPSVAAASPAVVPVDSTPPALAPERPARSVPRAAGFESRSVQVAVTAQNATLRPSRSFAQAPVASAPVATEAVGAAPGAGAPIAAAPVAGLPAATTPVARTPIAAAAVAAPFVATAPRHTASVNPAAPTARIEIAAPVAPASVKPGAFVPPAAPAPSPAVALNTAWTEPGPAAKSVPFGDFGTDTPASPPRRDGGPVAGGTGNFPKVPMLKSPARAARREGVASAPPSLRAAPAETVSPAMSPVVPSAIATLIPTTAGTAVATPARAADPLAPAPAPRRPASRPAAAQPTDERADDRAARAPEQAPSADLRVQARALEKAPPAFPFENVAKAFGTPVAGDKSESSKPSQIHPATLVGHAPVAALAPHRLSSFERVAALPARAAAPALQARAHEHETPSGRRPPATATDVVEAIAARAPHLDRVPTPAPHLSHLAPTPAPFDAILAALPPPAPIPAASSALLAHAAEDPSLRATVMPERAVLSIDTGSAGELALHLRVKDGVADVRVSGAAAHTVEMRPSELRAALASEGLTLGSFQSGQSAPEHNRAAERTDDDAVSRPASRGVATTAAVTSDTSDSSTAAVAAGRGFHVTA
jgi:hypothetical protein